MATMIPLQHSIRRCLMKPSRFRSALGSLNGGILFQRFSSVQRDDDDEHFSAAQFNENNQIITAEASVVDNGTRVVVSFNGEEQSTFHAPWLWSNDPSWVHPSSGQRLRTPGGYTSDKVIKSADIVKSTSEKNPDGVVLPFPPPPKGSSHAIGGIYESSTNDESPSADAQCLRVAWQSRTQSNQTDSDVSYYDLGWLRHWRYDEDALESRRATTKVTPLQALGNDGAIPTLDYTDMERDPQDFAFELLAAVVESGAALVQNAPTDYTDDVGSSVAKVGLLLGGSLSHGALYDDVFHVKSVPDAKNIAYTSVPLGPHQDLAYYESKPGLQLLHCISNEGVEGGESVLVDAMAAAQEFRRIAPEHFETLTQCPATFVKQREGADMMYRRPHIVLDDSEDIVSVNWSPPFEGPLSVSPHLVEAYYNAYRAFELMLDNSLPEEQYSDDSDPELVEILREYAQEYTWQRGLETGEMLIFNNVRMLHGRRGFDFSGESGGRHLMGCYTNIDDTLNHYRVLRRERSGGVPVRNVGNGTSGMP